MKNKPYSYDIILTPEQFEGLDTEEGRVHHITTYVGHFATTVKLFNGSREGECVEKPIVSLQDVEISSNSIVEGRRTHGHVKIDGESRVELYRFNSVGRNVLRTLMRNEGIRAHKFFDAFSSPFKGFVGKIIHWTDFRY